MVICDTNIIIELYKNNKTVKQKCRKIGINNFAISAVSAGEIFFGALNKKEMQEIENHLKLII